MSEPTHTTDPMKAAWDEVGDGFTKLARLVRDRYRERAGGSEETAVTPAPGAASTIRPASEPKSSGTDPADAFRKAFDSLIAAAKDLSERASDITHSEEIRSQARQAGKSLSGALSHTVDSLVDDLSDLFQTVKTEFTKGRRNDSTGTGPDTAS